MDDGPHGDLSRRERQIMDVIYRRGGATAAQIRREIRNAPSYSAVRALLRIMEEKGYVTHTSEDGRYVFRPTVPQQHAAQSAIRHVVRTFFAGSTELAVANLLNSTDAELSDDELARIAGLIEKARVEGQ